MNINRQAISKFFSLLTSSRCKNLNKNLVMWIMIFTNKVFPNFSRFILTTVQEQLYPSLHKNNLEAYIV